MTMHVRQQHFPALVPADHPTVQKIRDLAPLPNILEIFRHFHETIAAEGYRIGFKYLDAGVHTPQTNSGKPRPYSQNVDPFHRFFKYFTPIPHPSDVKYPTPPVLADDIEKYLPDMQNRQKCFELFEIYDGKKYLEQGWPTKIDPHNWSWHSTNLYVTPLHSSFYFLNIDDINTPEKKEDLCKRGIKPALVTISSINPATGEENQQWTIKIRKHPNFQQQHNLIEHFSKHLPKPVDDEAAKNIAQLLNKEFGDPDVTSCTRPFRLPGFYQLKSKYIEKGIFHTVSIKSASGEICPVTEALYLELVDQTAVKTQARKLPPVQKPHTPQDAQEPAKTSPATRPDADYHPENPIFMAHAREVHALDPGDPKLAPGRRNNNFRTIQRLIITGSDDFLQKTELYEQAKKYIKEREESNLYIYLRTENSIDEYHNDFPTQRKSFDAHYKNAFQYYKDHMKSVLAAAKRMFYMRHSRSVIERTLIESEITIDDAFTIAKKACSPTNRQIHDDKKYITIWPGIEKNAQAVPRTIPIRQIQLPRAKPLAAQRPALTLPTKP